jgi:hypothetical protein
MKDTRTQGTAVNEGRDQLQTLGIRLCHAGHIKKDNISHLA